MLRGSRPQDAMEVMQVPLGQGQRSFELQTALNQLDTDNSGLISKHAFVCFFLRIGVSQDEAETLLVAHFTAHGCVEYDGFLRWLVGEQHDVHVCGRTAACKRGMKRQASPALLRKLNALEAEISELRQHLESAISQNEGLSEENKELFEAVCRLRHQISSKQPCIDVGDGSKPRHTKGPSEKVLNRRSIWSGNDNTDDQATVTPHPVILERMEAAEDGATKQHGLPAESLPSSPSAAPVVAAEPLQLVFQMVSGEPLLRFEWDSELTMYRLKLAAATALQAPVTSMVLLLGTKELSQDDLRLMPQQQTGPVVNITVVLQKRVDGKKFFRNARASLTSDDFSNFVQIIKRLNLQEQTREQALIDAQEFLTPSLLADFEILLNAHIGGTQS